MSSALPIQPETSPTKTIDVADVTPMMRQYLEIKSEYPDAIIFYRLGDFYEMFYEDALVASKILDLTLTTRNKNDANPVPLCGVPHHAAEAYLNKLVESGKKVVVCEQTEEAKPGKGLVKREVTRILTPGTLLNPESLDAKSANQILVLHARENHFPIFAALTDVTTGDLILKEFMTESALYDDLARQNVREIIFSENANELNIVRNLKTKFETLYFRTTSPLFFEDDFARDTVLPYWNANHVAALGLDGAREKFIPVLSGLLNALKESKLLSTGLLALPRVQDHQDGLVLDEAALSHLDIFKTADGKTHGSLFWYLDRCITPLGSRRLAEELKQPLQDIEKIRERQDVIAYFLENRHDEILTTLQQIADLARLANRFLIGSGTPRDALALAQSLEAIQSLQNNLPKNLPRLFQYWLQQTQALPDLKNKIITTIQPDPPATLQNGGVILAGVSADLDEVRLLEKDSKNILAKLETDEKNKTGISSLKIRYNNVFGYSIEVTHTHKDKVPAHYIRKQTLTNAERYITEELKILENKILSAGQKALILEQKIFSDLCQIISENHAALRQNAEAIGHLDFLYALAEVAKSQKTVRPEIISEPVLNLMAARHPVLEAISPADNFVPNDIHLDPKKSFEMILTGPNMAGKSTAMRMVALITLLAHIGAYVPCKSATIGLCDRILTRVGAHDNLQKGLSTFMVEMVETAKILREATSKSLVILDEIGRGTSTFDGLSIAWAVAEDIHNRIKCRTLFATHYHELCDLAETCSGITNAHMAVREWNNEIIFLRKIKNGGANRSYGVTVAGMAGIPTSVVTRARDILSILEKKDVSFSHEVANNQPALPLFAGDPPYHDVIDELRHIDLNNLTPLEALTWLAQLKNRIS